MRLGSSGRIAVTGRWGSFEIGEIRVAQIGLFAERLGTLQRSRGVVRPHSLQVRVAIRRIAQQIVSEAPPEPDEHKPERKGLISRFLMK